MVDFKVGIALFRDGKPVSQVVWSIGFTDSWVGDYLLVVRGLPYAWDNEDPLVVCWVDEDILADMAELMIQRRFEVCPNVCEWWERFNLAEYDAAAKTGAELRELVEQYQAGDEFRYYSDD